MINGNWGRMLKVILRLCSCALRQATSDASVFCYVMNNTPAAAKELLVNLFMLGLVTVMSWLLRTMSCNNSFENSELCSC